MTIADIWRNKWLDLPPFWTRNACEIKKKITPRPNSATLKFIIKEVGWYDYFGVKHVEDYLGGFWVSVEVNRDTRIEIREEIHPNVMHQDTGVLSIMNSPYEDTFTVYFGAVTGTPGVRYYIIFDLYIEGEFPEGEEVHVETIYESGGSGQSYDNVVNLILQILYRLPEIIFMIILAKIIFWIM